MSLREVLYEEAMEARKSHPKLVEEYIEGELHKTSKKGEFLCRIGAYTTLEDGKEITREEVENYAKENDLDFDEISIPATGRWYYLYFGKKEESNEQKTDT